MRIKKKRRIEGKTDYKSRAILLKSSKPRIVVRKTNKYIIVQYVTSKEAQDFILLSVNSKELIKYGWPEKMSGSLKSIPAAYLTGKLIGKRIKEKYGEIEAVFDIGLIRNVAKSRVYAVLKGLVDEGIKISHSKEIFPGEERLKGIHLKNKITNVIESVKEKIEKE